MVCWFHPIFNVFRFHVKMLFFFDKDKARISARVFKKSHTANRGFFQRRQSIYISCEVRCRQSVIHILYEVDTLLQKQTHITLSNLSLSKATSKQPLGPDFQKNSVRSQRGQAWKLREVPGKSKWKFKMAFAIRRPTPPPPPP